MNQAAEKAKTTVALHQRHTSGGKQARLRSDSMMLSENNSIFHHYKIVRDFEEFTSLRDAWNELLRYLPSYLPSMTFEWNHAWIQANLDRIDYLFILIFFNEDEHITGIVPFYAAKSRFPLLRRPMLDLVGGKDHYMVSFLTLQEHLLQLIRKTMRILEENTAHWHYVAFRRVSQSQALSVQLERVLQANQIRFHTESFIRVPVIYLHGDFESFTASLKKHFRKEIRRKAKRIEELNLGEISFDHFQATVEPVALEQFTALEAAGWKGDLESSLKHRPRLLQTYKNLAELQQGLLTMLVFQMKVGDKLISSSICLQTSNGIYVFRIAYDEKFSKYSPGLLLRLHEIEYAFNRGLEIYNFSGVEQPWMRHFTHRGYHSMDFIVYNQRLVSSISYFLATRVKPWLKRFPAVFSYLKHLNRN